MRVTPMISIMEKVGRNPGLSLELRVESLELPLRVID